MPQLTGLQVALITAIILVLIFLIVRTANEAEPRAARTAPPVHTRAVRVMRIFGGDVLRRELLRHILNAGILTDAQNVHDSSVVKCISAKYRRLVELQPDVQADLIPTLFDISEQEIMNMANKTYTDEATPQQIAATLTNIRDSAATISSLGPESVREIEVLVRVQLRCDDPSIDSETAKSLWEMLLKQILDMRENNNYVCVTGRVSRMLNVFTAVDTDPILAEAELSATQLQTAIINRAHAVIRETLEADPEMQKTYDESDVLPVEISDLLKARVKDTLQEEYRDKVDAATLAKLIEESQDAI